MDDRQDDKYARAPEIEDVIKICRALNEQKASYVLIGGIAVIFHGFTRGTADIDFIVDSSVENIQKVKRALAILPDNAAAKINDDEVMKYTVVRVADEVVIDLMEKACGIDFAQASKEIVPYEIDGIEIPVASKELLIRLKNTVRPSDKMDVEYLKASLKKSNK